MRFAFVADFGRVGLPKTVCQIRCKHVGAFGQALGSRQIRCSRGLSLPDEVLRLFQASPLLVRKLAIPDGSQVSFRSLDALIDIGAVLPLLLGRQNDAELQSRRRPLGRSLGRRLGGCPGLPSVGWRTL